MISFFSENAQSKICNNSGAQQSASFAQQKKKKRENDFEEPNGVLGINESQQLATEDVAFRSIQMKIFFYRPRTSGSHSWSQRKSDSNVVPETKKQMAQGKEKKKRMSSFVHDLPQTH